MQPITKTKKLADACARLAQHPFVTVDTEFLRESTYYPRAVRRPDGEPDEAVVVDAIADGIDLAPFFALMGDEKVIKVFTPPARTSKSAGTRPASSRTRSSTPRWPPWCSATAMPSPTTSVQRITGDSPTNRPLHRLDPAAAQRGAARLRDLRRHPSARRLSHAAADLEKRGRSEWMREEMKVLTSAETYRFEPEHAWSD